MSTAVAAPATTLPPSVERQISPRQFASIAPSPAASAQAPPLQDLAPRRARSNGSPEGAPVVEQPTSAGKSSPNSHRNGVPPMIKVKKEPGSPALASSRPRPKRLDLSSSTSNNRGPPTGRPSAPLTSRESAGLAIQDVGLACLSPGFQTNDPGMREQLQRSLDVREQQRQIIEARQKGSKPTSSHEYSDGLRTQDNTLFGVPTGIRTPTTSRRKGPPPGLSIAAPSAAQFANDRVIQSAPLHQTFTGLRPGEYPHTRHAQHGPSGLSQTSHIHHVPATQTNNRLPPISDVFANDRLEPPRYASNNSPGHSSHSNAPPTAPSPGFPPSYQQPPMSGRSREFRSAEEAVHGLSGGRDDLMPKVVHYGGVQPPTPPSPMPRHQQTAPGAPTPPQQQQHQHHYRHDSRPETLTRTSSTNGRRRDREEYERDNGSPPSSWNRSEPKRPTFAVRDEDRGHDWKAGMSSVEKREEFLRLCERAWDLFHS